MFFMDEPLFSLLILYNVLNKNYFIHKPEICYLSHLLLRCLVPIFSFEELRLFLPKKTKTNKFLH